MSLYPKSPFYIGVEVSSSSIKTASIRKTRKGWEISHLKEIPKEENVNPLYNTPKDGIVISAISSREVLVRCLDVAAKKEKDALLAVEFQIEPQLPFPVEQAIVQAEVLEKKESIVQLSSFIVKKDHVQKHLLELHFNPERVTAVPLAIAAFANLIVKTSTPTFWIHIGEEDVTCALVQQGKLLAARAFDRNSDIIKEIQKTVLKISSSQKTKTFETIFLLGQNGSLASEIQAATHKTVLFPASVELSFSQEELVRFGLCIGIALAHHGPNFRQKEFTYPFPFKRMKKTLIITTALFCLLFGCLFSVFQISLTRQKNIVQTAYENLLLLEGKKTESIAWDSPSIFRSALGDLEKEIHARPDTYPLYPQIPKAKDLLAWLSSLPQELGKSGSQVEIHSCHYLLVKKPDFSHKKDRYKVKVELEFTAENPGAARALHDAIAASTSLIDQKEELIWSGSKGKYKAEFFLKDKTRYY